MAEIKQQKSGKYSVRIGNQKFNDLSKSEAQRRADTNYQVAPDSVTDSPAQKVRNAAVGIKPGDSNATRDAALKTAPITPAISQAPVAQINTSQPSPGSTPVGPQNAPGTIDSVESAKAAGAYDVMNGAGSFAQSLADRQKQGLAAVKGSGMAAPTTQGQAGLAMASATPQAQYTPPPEIMDEVDTAVNSYMTAITDYLKPEKQRKTLVQEYQALSKSLGIPDLQADLIDINRIMDGTEDDIRSEVTAASGFATESQVQAMTIGRNKSLLKKAQYISDTLTAAKDQLATLANLNAQDRQIADQKMQTGIQLLGNVVQIKQTMQKAAQDNYRWYADKAGMDNLYASTGGDPYNISMVERTLGLPSGGLYTSAVQAQKDRQMAQQKDQLQLDVLRSNLQTDAIQRKNIQSQIDERNKSTDEGPLSRQSVSSATGANETLNTINTAMNQVGLNSIGRSIAQYIPGTKTKDLRKNVDTIKSALTLDKLQELKRNSPNGSSGLGSATEREGQKLEESVASLDLSQSTDQLKSNIKKVETHYINYLSTLGYSTRFNPQTKEWDVIPIIQ